ncbi:hypothetical protein [Achromobacter ruhlandii]|uniref:hypothetical protein n=1 Tax=Achromobacter ruhlandii TaxID=72557 RepID=UPI003BA0D09C
MATFSHREMCSAAVEWLLRPDSKKGPGCTVAFSEVQSPCGREVMDAFGVRAVGPETYSVLVEVKTSRADFRADLAKPHRQDQSLSGGTYRYYFAPAGLIVPEELPPRWGLIEYGRPRFRVTAGHLTVRPGPALRYHEVSARREAEWAHSVNHGRELGTIAKLLARLGDVETLQNELKRLRGKHSRQQTLMQELHHSERQARNDAQTLRWVLADKGIDFDQALAELREREGARVRQLLRQRRTR